VFFHSFCQNGGSPLYKTSSGFPDLIFFHAATLDDPSQYRPQSVVWARSGSHGIILIRRCRSKAER
jgi:hypothetical protein